MARYKKKRSYGRRRRSKGTKSVSAKIHRAIRAYDRSHVEKKHVDDNLNHLDIITTGLGPSGMAFFGFYQIVLGGDADQRIGHQIYRESIRYDLTLNGTISAGGDAYNIIRILCIQWSYYETLPTNLSDLFNFDAGTQTDYTNALLNYDNILAKKFHVLSDRKYTVYTRGLTGSARHIKGKIPLKYASRRQQFASGTASAIRGNAILWYAFSDSSTAPHPQISGVIRQVFSNA